MAAADRAVFASVQDFVDEGVDDVVARLHAYGITRVALSVAYHQARDVTPHSSTRLTVRLDGAYFDPPPDLFGPGSLAIPVVDGLEDAPSIIPALRERGLAVDGWGVYCHNTTIGLRTPDVTQANCFGGRGAPADLCPAHPRVRQYAIDLGVATARLGVDQVIAESLHYGQLDHGYHHERSFVPLGPLERFMLGLCFCRHCEDVATAAGIDVGRARAAACSHTDAVLAGAPASGLPLTIESLATVGGPDLAAFTISRTATVTSLVASVAAATAELDTRLAFIDLSGAILGYADGLPQGPPAVESGWRFGIDLGQIAAHADCTMLAYARDADRVAEDTAAYRRAIGDGARLRTVLRPGWPDCSDAQSLVAKVEAAEAAGANAVDFYHYGLSTWADLDRIAAVRSDRG